MFSASVFARRCFYGAMARLLRVACGTTTQRRAGLSVVELLVALAIISLLLALLIVAVQSTRQSARRTSCVSNLRELALAVNIYESARGVYPSGVTAEGYSLHVNLLPYLERADLFERFDDSQNPRQPRGALQTIEVGVFVCPNDRDSTGPQPRFNADAAVDTSATSYAGNMGSGVQRYGYNGAFHPSPKPTAEFPLLQPGNISDGLSNTAALSEVLVSTTALELLRFNWSPPQSFSGPEQLDEFANYCMSLTLDDVRPDPPLYFLRGRPWTYGGAGQTLYNHVLAPNRISCLNGSLVQEGAYSAASLHPGGVNLAFLDARVTFVSSDIDLAIWRAYGSRNGREPVE
jgi:prepilin-type processing-associated H-X9-DG protein